VKQVRRAILVFAALLGVSGTLSAAPWSDVPLAQWTEGKTLEVVRGAKEPFGTWSEQGGKLLAQGTANCWSTRLAPGDQGGDQRVRVRFTVQASSRQPWRPPAGPACVRWGHYWYENAPGWDVGVVLRWKDPLNFYRVQLSATRGELVLWDSTGEFLQMVPCPVKLGQAHTLDVIAHGAHFTAKLDGKEVLDYWDRSLPHTKGQVGLSVWQSTVGVEEFDVTKLKPEKKRMPRHQPDFRFQMLGKTQILFDGFEPICRFFQVTRNHPGALYLCNIRLKPGWRPSYYTWYGPGIAPGGNPYVIPMVGKLPEAFQVSKKGKVLEFAFKTAREGTAKADHVCTVRYDPKRGVYRYEFQTKLAFTHTKELKLSSFEMIDPLTFNNRKAGPEVVHRWNWAEHAWHVFKDTRNRWARYPLIDYLAGCNNSHVYWGKSTTFLYPDPAACPAFEVDLKWTPQKDRTFNLGLCHWGYDYHHSEGGPHQVLPSTEKRDYTVTLTALLPAEAEAIFNQSNVADKVAKSKDRYPNFNAAGNTFAEFSTRADPTSTMVWEDGTIDETVGREDSCSLRIDGPAKGFAQVYQYAFEQNAEKWWVRGWYKSADVKGRGLQLRVKYSYAKKPEQIFYLDGRGDNDWTYFSFVTTAPKQRDCTDISFELDGSGQVWIDDVAFSALKPGEEPKQTRFSLPKDFEPKTDVVADLPMTEKPGLGVYDSSHNGHHLLLFGGTKWMQEQGRGFLRFDGVDDRGTIPIKPTLSSLDYKAPQALFKTLFPYQQVSYEIWARPQMPVGNPGAPANLLHYRWNPIFRLQNFDAKKHSCQLFVQNNRRLPTDHWRATGKVEFLTEVPLGKWSHIVATYGGGKAVLYVNGRAVGEANYDVKTPGFEFFAYKAQFHVGCWYGQRDHYHGDLGPIRLHTKALSADEAAERFKNSWPAK